ncbi:MAG: NAD(P)/FAD-dependent oxidoreductase [Dehalococcoidales bacterium]|nr:NAD(P)/FAD-dependent oxidoreductase [Dehalococcoidales bacterium]
MHDVVIIGGGLIGSYSALRLTQAGCRVLVLERKKRIEGKAVCTGIIGRECAETFAIDRKFILREARGARIFSPSGKELHIIRPETQAYVLDRVALDVALAERAQNAGAEYVLDCAAQNVQISHDCVEIRVQREGKPGVFSARSALVSCGFGSGLTESLCLGKANDFVLGAQAEVAAPGIEEIEVYSGREIAPGFFGWLVPAAPGRARAGLLSRRNPGDYLRRLLGYLQSQGRIAGANVEIKYGSIPLKPPAVTYGERVLVAGDAAGQVKPTTGGGIYYGLLCADFAVATLVSACQSGDFSARGLALYERNWQQKLQNEMRTGYRARKLFERLSDRQIDRIFDIIIDNGIDKELSKAGDVSFDWHSGALLRLMGHSVLRGAFGRVIRPFQ